MANMSLVKNPMPMQEPMVRNKNFEEVALGLTEDAAVDEALRCLHCKNSPCVSGCPVNVRIPEFIKKVVERKFEEAYEIITSTNSLPAVCGRVCPQENQCEGVCVRGKKGEPVGIGRLERFVADYHMMHRGSQSEENLKPVAPNGKKVAVIGAGPSGLTCAGDLAKMGYKVTLFESLHKAGGVLIYGIPEFRLPKAIVAQEIKRLEDMGVELITNAVVGRTMSVDDLFEDGYEAIYIGSGAGLPSFMNIPGENCLGVFSANEYLTRINLMKAYLPEYDTPIKPMKATAVIGGGNVAMDAARCAKRMGADQTYVVYRRSMDELPARAEEVHNAIEEGICFKLLNNPVAILGNEQGYVCGLECVEMELGEPDESGRRCPIEKKGSNFVLDVDSVIIAIGTRPNPIIWTTTSGLNGTKKGCIVVGDDMATTREGIYAGGDAATGAATVIQAMGAGKTAATSIDKYLNGK